MNIQLSKEDIKLILDSLYYLKNTINSYKTLTNNTKLVSSTEVLIYYLEKFDSLTT